MKIDLREIEGSFQFKIEGEEPWLKEIYQTFPQPSEAKHPLLQADLSFMEIGDNLLSMDCHLRYSPFVDCSRCGIKIEWPIDEKANFVFSLAPDQTPMDEDCATYIESEANLKVAPLLNDLVQLALPTRLVRDTNGSCVVCLDDISDSHAFGVKREDDPTNPFAGLEDKLKLN